MTKLNHERAAKQAKMRKQGTEPVSLGASGPDDGDSAYGAYIPSKEPQRVAPSRSLSPSKGAQKVPVDNRGDHRKKIQDRQPFKKPQRFMDPGEARAAKRAEERRIKRGEIERKIRPQPPTYKERREGRIRSAIKIS